MLEINDVRNPFPGLRPFETDENNLFFGRDGQSDELLERLRRARFLAVVGTSGSGKSSLIRAGLLPALYGGLMGDAGSSWRIAIHRPGGDPIGNLAEALARKDIFGAENNSEIQKTLIETTLRRSSIGLIDVARQGRMQPHENLLVVVDQFEELFRFKQAHSGDDATAFVKLLLEAGAQSELPIYIVLTMRSDFLGDCSQFAGLPEAINKGQYLIPRMSRDERRSAIVGPVAVGAAEITTPLVNRLLNDVGDNPDQLPILQHALMRTWDYWAAHRRNGQPIALEDYESIGGMAEALSLHADEAWAELPTERSRQVAERLFKELTEKGADNRETRRPSQVSEICGAAEASSEEVSEVIEVFRREGRSFLMPPAGVHLADDTIIDISHESLIRNWDRLQTWVDEEAQSARIYHRLAESAVLHRDGKEGLLIDPALQIALDWRDTSKPNPEWGKRYHLEYDQALKYLENSRLARETAQLERERQRNAELERARHEREQAEQFAAAQASSAKRLRWLAAGMAVMCVVAGAAAILAFLLWIQAKSNAARALEAQNRAVLEREKADEASQNAQASAIVAQIKTFQLDAERLYAESQRQAAEKAKQAALAAEANAEKQRVAAVKAQKQAEDNAAQFAQAVDRGRMMREGLEAYQHQDSKIASQAFDDLATSLTTTLQGKGLLEDKRKDLKIDLGWAQSNLGKAQLSTGDVEAAKDSYEKSRTVLEEVWPKSDRERRSPEDILFDTYNGLGHAYRDIALIGSEGKERIDSASYFQKAKNLYLDSLNYQQTRLSDTARTTPEFRAARRQVAEGFKNLALLHGDMGLPNEKEKNLEDLVAFQTKYGDHEANIAAQKGVAEFYRNRTLERVAADTADLKKNLEKARLAYNKLLDFQENITNVGDYAKVPPEITSSYTELSFIYRGLADLYDGDAKVATDEATSLRQAGDENGEKQKLKEVSIKEEAARDANDKASAAIQAVTAIQSLSRRLRSLTATDANTSRKGDDRDELADVVGNIYLRLNQFDKALKLFEFALDVRRRSPVSVDHDLVWKSLFNLASLYRKHPKNDPRAGEYDQKAEQYSRELVEFLRQQKPNSGTYADALIQLASLYVDVYSTDPAKSSQAESFYREARGIYAKRNDWWNQNLITFRLSKLYEKQKRAPEREQALNERVELLTGYFSNLVAQKQIQPNDPITLVSEYLHAINALAYFYGGRNPAGAETAYARALSAHNYITQNIYNEKIIGFYADTLKDYAQLLNNDKQQTAAKQVIEKEMMARDKLHQFDQIREQQNVQQVRQGSATAP